MEDKMKPVFFAHGELEEGHTAPRHVCISTNELALNRYKNESRIRFSYPDYGLLCDEETFKWIVDHQVNGVIVITKENYDELKKLHFYKEIIMI
jgi:hypothetical protein